LVLLQVTVADWPAAIVFGMTLMFNVGATRI
jgi:hypothetical protein